MNKFKHVIIVGAFIASTALLSACQHAQLPVNGTPDQVAAAKVVAEQANFDQACKYASGAVAVAKPILVTLEPKLGHDGALALESFLSVVQTTCATPLDITNADAIIQRVYDAGGNIVALVIKSGTA